MNAGAVTSGLLLLVAFTTAKDEFIDHVISNVKDCMATVHLDSITGFRSDREMTSSELKCFIGCFLKKLNAVKDDGHYNVAGLKNTIGHCPRMKANSDMQQAAWDVADECTAKARECGDDICECGAIIKDCLVAGMQSKGYQTLFVPLDEALDVMDP